MPPLHWTVATVVAGATLAASAASAAPAQARRVDVDAGPLAASLAELARENQIEILFDAAAVRGRQAPALRGRLTTPQALSRLLAGTGLTYRATADGVFVLVAEPEARMPEGGDGAIAEVLVLGRRTQNADIRRSENDIQPYTVLGPRTLSLAPADDLDQLARGRVPANAQTASASQTVLLGASTLSSIDLRGLGAARTLVLIDGRRMPGLPTQGAGLDQPDLNPLPLGAIARVETLTATAGGIHGPSALGGVMNVVLRRDPAGADLTLVSSLADRGDAGRLRLEGRVGWTPGDGATEIMLFGAYVTAQAFDSGERDYARRALARQAANDPASVLSRSVAADAVIVRSLSGRPLQLDAQLGGTPLGSSYTFLPLDGDLQGPAGTASLLANAGQLPTRTPAGGAGDASALLATPELGSVGFNVRRQVSPGLQAFVDGLYLFNRARAHVPMTALVTAVHADARSNPFTEAVLFTLPTSGLFDLSTSAVTAHRLTGGLIARLPHDWQASADYAFGRSVVKTGRDTPRFFNLPATFAYGSPDPEGRPVVDPLGDPGGLMAALPAYASGAVTTVRVDNRFQNAALRAAGPLWDLPGGPLTMTLLGELRREHMPEGELVSVTPGRASSNLTAARTQAVRSGYAELRAPLVAADAAFAPLRGLELQLALRRDEVRTTFPQNVLAGARFAEGETTIRHRADVFTLGGRVFPAPWLMLRASVATGQAPPDLRHLQERAVLVTTDTAGEPRDPQRGGRRITEDGAYLWVRGGSHDIGQEKGRTASLGLVVNPAGTTGPRLSIDYSRVEVRDEIVAFPLGFQGLLDAEARYPDRILRDPLSEADAARGYTAGRVTQLHFGLINGGRTVTEAVDVKLDWTLPPAPFGQGRLYASGTWQPTFRIRSGLDGPSVERSGYRDGPLPWRGHAGLDWTAGPLALDLNVQAFASRRISAAAIALQSPAVNAQRIRLQGSSRIPAQAYVDVAARRRFELPGRTGVQAVELRLAVQNLFDRSPPIVADLTGLGYDYVGDPRRRRIEVLLSAQF